MEQLRRNVIENIRSFPNATVGTLKPMPERVLQFGEGNFLRAFVDWQFNELRNTGKFNGSIVVVQPLENGMVDMLNGQDGLYTVVQRGYENGKLVEKTDVVTAVSRGINPYTHYQDFIACASNPDLRYVISNTTESGIEYVHQPMPVDACPASYPAKVTILLFERFKKFKGDAVKGLILIPCELIEQNGDALKKAVLHHAQDWNCGAPFIEWVHQHNFFCNTLVDRIVPGYPRDEVGELTTKFGYNDSLIVACEVFHKWVIQGDPIVQKELPFETIGLNVVWTDDITPHRTLKVRILNGAHTTFTIPALLSGKEFVKESMEDEMIGPFIRSAVFDEILPTLQFDTQEREKFAEAVLERFKNPFIKHELISITLNSVSKYKVRVLPSLLEYYHLHHTLPQRLCIGLAALLRFYKVASIGEKGAVGEYHGKQYPIQDSPEIIEYFDRAWKTHGDDSVALTNDVLSQQILWGMDLTGIPGFSTTTARYLGSIETKGMKQTLHSSASNDWANKILMHKYF